VAQWRNGATQRPGNDAPMRTIRMQHALTRNWVFRRALERQNWLKKMPGPVLMKLGKKKAIAQDEMDI
jgi:hypothetical protein